MNAMAKFPSTGRHQPFSTSSSHRCHRPPLHALIRAATTTTSTTSASNNNNNNGGKHLHNPARIGGTATRTTAVHDFGGTISLDEYMRLPPEQYSALDPEMIQSLGGDKFRLRVPRITLFSLWMEPMVDISVTGAHKDSSSSTTPTNAVLENELDDTTAAAKVVLKSENCVLKGSEWVTKMNLDQRFSLHFETELTWTSAIAQGNNSTDNGGKITGNLQLEIFSEVIPPFHVLPRKVLESTCNTVLKGLMKSLLPLFMRRLAADYSKWATDADYRAQRSALSETAAAAAAAAKEASTTIE